MRVLGGCGGTWRSLVQEIGGESERSKQTAERDKRGATRLWRQD